MPAAGRRLAFRASSRVVHGWRSESELPHGIVAGGWRLGLPTRAILVGGRRLAFRASEVLRRGGMHPQV